MLKPYYQREGITIYNGDCQKIVPSLEFSGLVLTDPPYGIAHPTNYEARGRGKKIDTPGGRLRRKSGNYPPVRGDDRPFDPSWLLQIGSAHILWGANYYADKLPCRSGWLVWDKERPDTLDQATCELAWTDCVKGVRRFRWLWNGMMRKGPREPLTHPTEKPAALMEWCFTLKWTISYQSILDPYMGSGSTLVAAFNRGRDVVGVEFEESYCEIAAKRLDRCFAEKGTGS